MMVDSARVWGEGEMVLLLKNGARWAFPSPVSSGYVDSDFGFLMRLKIAFHQNSGIFWEFLWQI